MAYRWIKAEQRDGIETLTLNDPSTLNAVNPDMNKEVVQEVERVEYDPAVRVLIFTGEGRGFCSGGNIKRMAAKGGSLVSETRGTREQFYTHLTDIRRVTSSLYRLSKPVIAAINGPAVGAGAGLAAACDIRIASEQARIAWSFVRRGIVADDGSLYYMAQILGYAKAFEWGITSRMLSAPQALELGFVSKVVPADQLMPTCLDLAREIISEAPPVTAQLFKLAFQDVLQRDLWEAILIADKANKLSSATEDHTEAVRSVAERRQAVWKGR